MRVISVWRSEGTDDNKESGVDDQGDRTADYAARRAEIERTFAALPTAGSQAYWDALTTPVADNANSQGNQGMQTAMPLEVLARCWRAWTTSKRSWEAERVYEIIVERTAGRLTAWSNRIARQAPGGLASGLAEELQQECYIQLLDDLRAANSFLFENFLARLTRIEQHMAHAVMERDGNWQRKGVQRPSRAPATQTDSLNTPTAPDSPQTRADLLADPTAQARLQSVEFLADLEAALSQLSPDQRLLYYLSFEEGATQREIADQFDVTPRTVRTRLRDLEQQLHSLLDDPDDPSAGDSQGERKEHHHD